MNLSIDTSKKKKFITLNGLQFLYWRYFSSENADFRKKVNVKLTYPSMDIFGNRVYLANNIFQVQLNNRYSCVLNLRKIPSGVSVGMTPTYRNKSGLLTIFRRVRKCYNASSPISFDANCSHPEEVASKKGRAVMKDEKWFEWKGW